MEEAAVEAVKQAALVQKEEETKAALEIEMLEIGEVGLEKKAMEAFKEYKEADQLVVTKSIVTDFDLEELETKKEDYLAVKKAKKDIMKDKMLVRLTEMRKLEDGVVLIEQEVEGAYDDLKHMKDKSNEFPDDEELTAEVAAQQTRVEAIDEVFVEILE
jgi:mannose-6-phosphate isomerase class I